MHLRQVYIISRHSRRKGTHPATPDLSDATAGLVFDSSSALESQSGAPAYTRIPHPWNAVPEIGRHGIRVYLETRFYAAAPDTASPAASQAQRPGQGTRDHPRMRHVRLLPPERGPLPVHHGLRPKTRRSARWRRVTLAEVDSDQDAHRNLR